MNELLGTDILKEIKELNKNLQQFKEIYTNIQKKEITEKRQGFRELDKKGVKDAIMTVREFENVYISDLNVADKLYAAQRSNMKLRQLEIQLRGGTVVFEGGQFMYSSGDLKQGKIDVSPIEIFRGTVRKLSGETFFRPSLTGSGTVVLDCSFNHITLFPITTPSRIVLEKGIYLASVGDFKFKTKKNLSAGYFFLSDKSLIQTDVQGAGILALDLPVPMSTLIEIDVTPDKPFQVDGNFVIMWSGKLKKNVIPAHGVLGSLTSGTGLVEEYTGTGKVWVAPLLDYQNVIEQHQERAEEQEEIEVIAKEDPSIFKGFLSRFFS